MEDILRMSYQEDRVQRIWDRIVLAEQILILFLGHETSGATRMNDERNRLQNGINRIDWTEEKVH